MCAHVDRLDQNDVSLSGDRSGKKDSFFHRNALPNAAQRNGDACKMSDVNMSERLWFF